VATRPPMLWAALQLQVLVARRKPRRKELVMSTSASSSPRSSPWTAGLCFAAVTFGGPVGLPWRINLERIAKIAQVAACPRVWWSAR